MKKKVYFTTLLAGLMLTACSSDDALDQNPVEPVKTYYMSVEASKGNDAAASRIHRALSLTGNTLTPSWTAGEKVYVYASTAISPFFFQGYLEAKDTGAKTRLNGALTLPTGWSGVIGDYISVNEFTLVFPRPSQPNNLDYTGQIGTLEDIAAKYDYAVAENVNFDIVAGDHIVATTKDITFDSQQAIVKFTLKDKSDGTTLLSPTALTIQYGEESLVLSSIPNATYSTNGAGVLYVAIPGFSGKPVTLTATCSSGTYTYTRASVTFENGQYNQIGVKMTKQP